MTADPENLIWIDLEMTGLDSRRDRIIEIATLVTDKHLNVIAEGPVIAIHQSDDVLAKMDDWNTRQHGRSGLTARVRSSRVDERAAELREVHPVDQLHRHVWNVVVLTEIEDLDDVRVIEERRDARLLQEHGAHPVVLSELRRDALQDAGLHEVLGTDLLGQVHLGHPALADELGEQVPAETFGLTHDRAELLARPTKAGQSYRVSGGSSRVLPG